MLLPAVIGIAAWWTLRQEEQGGIGGFGLRCWRPCCRRSGRRCARGRVP
ncbi:MAG: hypothetical protein R2713_09775 [Ilumatobacteraceae bacterium]